jgi:hypothetical protein
MRRGLGVLALLLGLTSPVLALDPGTYPAVLTIGANGEVSFNVQTTVQVPIWTLEIIVVNSGSPTPAAGSHVYQDASVVQLNSNGGGTWSGDTGCAGGASHSITMDANKRCTITY